MQARICLNVVLKFIFNFNMKHPVGNHVEFSPNYSISNSTKKLNKRNYGLKLLLLIKTNALSFNRSKTVIEGSKLF